MITTALIYNDQSNDCTYLLGTSEGLSRISVDKMIKMHLRAVGTLRAELSPEWDSDLLSTVKYDPQYHTANVLKPIPDIYVTVNTPHGRRWIAVPDIGDLMDGIRLRDYGLYDAIEGEDISGVSIRCPDYPAYSSDDLSCEVYSVRIVTHGGEDVSVWINDYTTQETAQSHASRIYWSHITDQPSLIDVVVTRDTKTMSDPDYISEGKVVWSGRQAIKGVQ